MTGLIVWVSCTFQTVNGFDSLKALPDYLPPLMLKLMWSSTNIQRLLSNLITCFVDSPTSVWHLSQRPLTSAEPEMFPANTAAEQMASRWASGAVWPSVGTDCFVYLLLPPERLKRCTAAFSASRYGNCSVVSRLRKPSLRECCL